MAAGSVFVSGNSLMKKENRQPVDQRHKRFIGGTTVSQQKHLSQDILGHHDQDQNDCAEPLLDSKKNIPLKLSYADVTNKGIPFSMPKLVKSSDHEHALILPRRPRKSLRRGWRKWKKKDSIHVSFDNEPDNNHLLTTENTLIPNPGLEMKTRFLQTACNWSGRTVISLNDHVAVSIPTRCVRPILKLQIQQSCSYELDRKTCHLNKKEVQGEKPCTRKVMTCPLCPKKFTGDIFMMDHFTKHYDGGLSRVHNDPVYVRAKRRIHQRNACDDHNKLKEQTSKVNTKYSNPKSYSRRYLEKTDMDITATILDYTYHEWYDIYGVMMLGWLCGFEGLCFILDKLEARHCWNAVRAHLLQSGDVEQNPGPPNTLRCKWDSCSNEEDQTVQDMAVHLMDHIYKNPQWCSWDGCVFYSNNCHYLESHVLQHIYQDFNVAKNFTTLDAWSKVLPGGKFNKAYTDLPLCPKHLRSQFEILLLDEHFRLPKKVYTLMDHEMYLIGLKEQNPEELFSSVQEFVQRRLAVGDHWDFNREKWSNNFEAYLYKRVDHESEDEEVCKPSAEQNPDCYPSIVNQQLTISRPELVGNYQSSVKFKLHTNTCEMFQTAKCKAIRFEEPWMLNTLFNIKHCQGAIELEGNILCQLLEKGFMSARNKNLINCEDKAYTLAAYPACTEGVFFFIIIPCDLHQPDPVLQYLHCKYYVRFIESGCYTNFMSQVVLHLLAQAFDTDINCFLLNQVYSETDIQEEKKKQRSGNDKRQRPDKMFKSNESKLNNHLQETLSSSETCNIDWKYFLHFVKQGHKVNMSTRDSDDWYITSNMEEDVQQSIISQLKEYPLTRVEEVSTTAIHFSEETLSPGASIFLQSRLLNCLPNNHRVYLHGKPLRFKNRFHISSDPASFRNKVISFSKKGKYADIIDLFKASFPVLSGSSVSNSDTFYSEELSHVSQISKRKKKASNVRCKVVTREMLEDSITARSEILFRNSGEPLTLYENYRRQLLQFGTLQIQVSDTYKVVAIMNDYDDEDGNFKPTDYVFTGRIQTGTGYTFTCSCKIYRTLLECLGTSDSTFDTLDTSNGMKCIHCRFFSNDIVPNLQFNENSTATQISLKVQNALSSLNQSIIPLDGKTNTRKFSVLVDDTPSFVFLTWNKTTAKFVISCMDGFCRSHKGAKKNVDTLLTGDVCKHLQKLQEKPELWTDFTNTVESATLTGLNEECVVVDESADTGIYHLSDTDIYMDSDAEFDVASGIWAFRCLSNHSPKEETSMELVRNVQERDSWNDRNTACIPRVDGCLRGPDLIEPIPSFDCLCSAGWTNSEFPHGRYIVDRKIVIYTSNAPVQSRVLTRLCVKHSTSDSDIPCRLKWDEGHSKCIHVSTRDTAAGDEIGWEFVNQVLTSRATFSSFCYTKNMAYKLRDPLTRNFMGKDSFIKWWFGWAASRKTDFRKPCPVCKYSPKQLACDGTNVGIGFRHAIFEPINKPSDPDDLHPTLHRRMDRCFLASSRVFSKEKLVACRAHLRYLASSVLDELKTDEILSDNEIADRNTILQETLPFEVLPSFVRFLGPMPLYEKYAYANLMKILSTTAPLRSLLPSRFIQDIKDLLDHVSGVNIHANGDVFFNETMHAMRHYAPEIRNVIAIQ